MPSSHSGHKLCTLLVAALLSAPGPIAYAQTREHVLLARQVGLPGPGNPAVAILVSNVPHGNPGAPPCHFTGAVRAEEAEHPFGAGLRDLVFEPLSLAPGESLAIDVPPTAPASQVVPSQVRVLIVAIEADDLGVGPCPLLVQALAYEAGSGGTELLLHRFTLGVEKSLVAGVQVRGPGPVGFIGGNVGQAARVILISDNQSPLPSDRCAPPGEVITRLVPRLDGSPASSTPSVEHSWPIKWQGPDTKAMALVEISFDEIAPGADGRIDALLSLRFDEVLPLNCQQGISGSFEVYDQATGQTRAAIPMDRVFFAYHHF
jgi:hypothetical protein